MLTNSSSKADLLNEQFKSVFSQHGPMKLKHIAKAALNQQMPGQHCHSCMASADITVERVKKLLSNLNPYKAVGPDSIHPRVLKELSAVIAPALCNIFRASLRFGVVPSDWKRAHVTPIYKKGPKSLPENYRPVSLACICSTIMEHITVSNIVRHFEIQHILNDFQHGFRRFHSCETQLIGFINDVARDMQNGPSADRRDCHRFLKGFRQSTP